jgi:hypothetical protein
MTEPIAEPVTDTGVETPVAEPESNADEPTTFDADYVKALRQEAAENRTAAKSATERGDHLHELLLGRTIEAAAADVLRDPNDLDRSDSRLYDEAGFPSLDGAREVATDLAAAKPWLAKPAGNISQGAREATEPVGFGQLIRERMHG